MKLLLTDVLRCPRCGPAFPLILLADEIDGERRVVRGRLGCSNCRTGYPVRDAVLDLRLSDAAGCAQSDPPTGGTLEERSLRLAALLGLSAGGGRVALRGPGAAAAEGVAALAPEVQVVAIAAEPGALPRGSTIDRIAAGALLPFADGSLRGVALGPYASAETLNDALRALAGAGRLVLDPGAPESAADLRALGARVLLEEDGLVVAEKPPQGAVAPPSRPE